ncbi:serine/threonine protein kinase [Lentzea sp. NBRC 105346]|uniref:serine/threonine-protein kinase n=1 Tax=Lentzea sp. NBRC 105346 TaxID=3032205 RepID=UPI0024A08F02|nr:serine/threonine-protein kinase [Lentzea sp. NBRC 105346]GLZ33660.1 serine/threonine protein kinase [Lentzea sp. NBRC 105346]
MIEPWDGDLTGQVIAGRYVVGTVIGTGGMAEVYRAYDRELSRSVAIKVFDGSAQPDDVVRLEREARMLSTLHCRGVVTVYDFGAHNRRPYYVMQEVTGGTLRQRMADPLPPAFVARVGGQIAQILGYVHEVGVVHRDIKPSNILIDDTEKQAYLADFGLALQAHVTRVTKSGILVGTAGYLAPEQVKGSTVGPKADVYALGLVLLECLTGRPEYPGGDAEAALARLSRLPRIPAGLPKEWSSLLKSMTELDPAKRPSALMCASALLAAQEASRGLPALLPEPEESLVDEPLPRRRVRKVGYAVAAAAAAVTALTVIVTNLGGSAPPANGNSESTSKEPSASQITETVSVTVNGTASTVTVVRSGDAPAQGSQPSSGSGSGDAPPNVTETSHGNPPASDPTTAEPTTKRTTGKPSNPGKP